jgi:hypothetical protein
LWNLKILCKSLIVYCSYPYVFASMCKKWLESFMTYVNFLFLLICHITFFLKLISCLNPMIKYDWLAEVSTLMWLVARRCDFSTNPTARSAIRAEIALLWTNQIAGNTIDWKMNIINTEISSLQDMIYLFTLPSYL